MLPKCFQSSDQKSCLSDSPFPANPDTLCEISKFFSPCPKGFAEEALEGKPRGKCRQTEAEQRGVPSESLLHAGILDDRGVLAVALGSERQENFAFFAQARRNALLFSHDRAFSAAVEDARQSNGLAGQAKRST
jgi:hypothetical protein